MNSPNQSSTSQLLAEFNFNSSAGSTERSEQFLRFHLLPSTTALLPVNQLTEVLEVPKYQVVPISNMSPWVMGVYNWRGEILWTIDLGQLIGLPPWYEQATSASVYTLVVLSLPKADTGEKQLLGMMVHRVEEIEWCDPISIQSPPNSAIAPELIPFLQGFYLDNEGEMMAVLSGKAILAALT